MYVSVVVQAPDGVPAPRTMIHVGGLPSLAAKAVVAKVVRGICCKGSKKVVKQFMSDGVPAPRTIIWKNTNGDGTSGDSTFSSSWSRRAQPTKLL